MRNPMVRSPIAWLLLACALAVTSLVGAHADDRHHRAAAPNVVVHLGHSTDDIHAADMALHLATHLLQHGASVVLFLDREGVRLADKRVPIAEINFGTDNVGADYSAFIEAGGQVLVCPHCAEYQGISAEMLRAGATMGTAARLTGARLAASKVIDY